MQILYAPESINATSLEGIRFDLWSNLRSAFRITLEKIAAYPWEYESNDVATAAYYVLYGQESPNDVPRALSGPKRVKASDWPLPSIDIKHLPDPPEVLLPYMEKLWRDPTFQKVLSLGHEYVQFDNVY
ncbi:MAG: hypothetical protein LQ337_006014 [Flavoplaca oasis]|nr:MAG: hypothetical protein LQ337_006014 [Flavoplaca oasis]